MSMIYIRVGEEEEFVDIDKGERHNWLILLFG